MLFHPILYSFLSYFIPYPLLHLIETTSKMPILPVLSIFVVVFCSSPLLSSLLILYIFIFSPSPSHFFCSFIWFAPPPPYEQK